MHVIGTARGTRIMTKMTVQKKKMKEKIVKSLKWMQMMKMKYTHEAMMTTAIVTKTGAFISYVELSIDFVNEKEIR